MKYRITAAGRTIGHSDLKNVDDGMGVHQDTDFVPTADYEKVRWVFRSHFHLLAEKDDEWRDLLLDACHAARDVLDVQVVDAKTGAALPGTLDIVDGADAGFELTLWPS